MTFLELSRKLRQYCGGSGTGPASVVDQVGENALWVQWVNQAYLEIQNERYNWSWRWAEASQAVAIGQAVHDTLGSRIDLATVYLDDSLLRCLDYREFRFDYKMLKAGVVTAFSVRPDHKLVFNAIPESAGTLTYEYYKDAELMSANDDVPLIPERFQDLVIYKAMMLYAGYENAPEVYQNGMSHYEHMLANMSAEQLPAMSFAGPLA